MKFIIPAFFSLLLAASAAFANVTFSETSAQRLVSTRMDGEVSSDVYSGGTFTARGKVIVPDGLTITFSNESEITLTIGNWTFEGTMSDDPKFNPAKIKPLSFRLPGGGTLSFALSRGVLTWSVTAKTGSTNAGDELETSPVAEDNYGSDPSESRAITAADEVTAQCVLAFDSLSAQAEVPLTGSVRVSLRKVGSGDLAEEYFLSSVRLKGTGNIAAD